MIQLGFISDASLCLPCGAKRHRRTPWGREPVKRDDIDNRDKERHRENDERGFE